MAKRGVKHSDSAESIIKLVVILNYISAVFLGILGFIMIILSSLFWSMVSGLIKIPLIFMIVISLFMLGFGIFQFFVAGGLMKKESWARTSAIVLGVLMLFSFPIGTFIGIITIFFLVFNKEIIRMFH